MNGRPRLSLRARLLAALLVVTTAFLVVLGVVASVVFGGRLGNAFDAQLVVAARRQSPAMVGATDTHAGYSSPHTARPQPPRAGAAGRDGHRRQPDPPARRPDRADPGRG